MSGRAMGWVLKHGPEDRTLRSVLLTIADAADPAGENAHPGIAGIVEGSLYSRRRVQQILPRLIEDGWIEVTEEGGGRGRATVYRVVGVPPVAHRKGATSAPIETGNGAIWPEKGRNPDAEIGKIAEVVPLLSRKQSTLENNESPLSDDVTFLCEILADRVATQQDDRRPAITPRWRTDMRLLLERGPLGQAQPERVSRGKIHATIDFVFDEMAEPEGNSNFCWADQVRSPGALRRHWHKMAKAAKNKLQARRSPTARILERLSPGAGSGPLPVHLLHPERKALPS